MLYPPDGNNMNPWPDKTEDAQRFTAFHRLRRHLGLRLTRAEMILDLTPWEGGSDLTTVVAFLRPFEALRRKISKQQEFGRCF